MAATTKTLAQLREALEKHADAELKMLPKQDCYDLCEALDLLERIRIVMGAQDGGLFR